MIHHDTFDPKNHDIFICKFMKNITILFESNEYITIFFIVPDWVLWAICSVSVRHKCGTAAAQSRTKTPDFCTLDPCSVACGLKKYPVCSEALRSPLPLIANPVTVPFCFDAYHAHTHGPHLTLCFYRINTPGRGLRTPFLLCM